MVALMVGFDNEFIEMEENYQVYINGEVVGIIKSSDQLTTYMENKVTELEELYQTNLKQPENIKIQKILTITNSYLDDQELIELIDQKAEFLIKSYDLFIDGRLCLSAISKDHIDKSIENILITFSGEKNYKDIIELNVETDDYGVYLKEAYLNNTIEVKETYNRLNDVLISIDEVSEHLLYGEVKEHLYTTVELGDTIESIAHDNQLNIDELLIANPFLTYNKEDKTGSLLSLGEEIIVDLINPQLDVIIEEKIIYEEVLNYPTEIIEVDYLTIGYQEEVQTGINGLNKTTMYVQSENGVEINHILASKETILEPIPRIIHKGKTYDPLIGDPTIWRWPSTSTFVSSPYEWRWGKFHYGIDIAGAKVGSPIYAANNGYVQDIYYDSIGGWQVLLNHGNGWYTVYAHIDSNPTKFVSLGQIVKAGTVIGDFGDSGYVTGPNLHFEIWKGGKPYTGTRINPKSVNYYYK
jgi:murein DD-endopeptidase MepM/ murein hydrolase activator NlpD